MKQARWVDLAAAAAAVPDGAMAALVASSELRSWVSDVLPLHPTRRLTTAWRKGKAPAAW